MYNIWKEQYPNKWNNYDTIGSQKYIIKDINAIQIMKKVYRISPAELK
jgi:hypothetical protein